MKNNEIRIGNYIASSGNIENKETWVIGKVYSINAEDASLEQIEVETEDEFTWFFKDNYFGIPLTEEWLLKFGFDNVRKNILVCHNEYHNNRINEGAYYVEPVGDAFNHWYLYHKVKMITSNIRYVHQLQNLYFALTGEELEIKTRKG